MSSSSSSLDSADLTSAKRKIAPLIDFSSLPASVIDPLWDRVEAAAGLTLGELGALKNARCATAGKAHCRIILLYSYLLGRYFIFSIR